MSCLQALNSNLSHSQLSPLVLHIKSLIFNLNILNYTIHFIWNLVIPALTAMRLLIILLNLRLTSLTQLLHSDFTPFIKRYISNLWSSYWNNLPTDFASRYRDITTNINNIWFSKLEKHRSHIRQFNRLRIGHSLLPSHLFKLGLNDSSFCTLNLNECICDLSRILFD